MKAYSSGGATVWACISMIRCPSSIFDLLCVGGGAFRTPPGCDKRGSTTASLNCQGGGALGYASSFSAYAWQGAAWRAKETGFHALGRPCVGRPAAVRQCLIKPSSPAADSERRRARGFRARRRTRKRALRAPSRRSPQGMRPADPLASSRTDPPWEARFPPTRECTVGYAKVSEGVAANAAGEGNGNSGRGCKGLPHRPFGAPAPERLS